MKTKNIFRMLLVAVILLLGANNVMADTHKLTYQITNPDWSTEVYTTYDIEEGAAIPSEPAPEARIGQTFGGWENVPEKMPNYDLTIIGKFTAIQYAITINSAEHGTLSIYSGATATYGQEITIHPNAEYGYEVESISVVDENNNSLDLTSDYTFTMPACAVTISGTFKPKAAPTYNITLVYNSSQGSATLSKDTSSGNEEIQLTVTPNDGFEVESVTASDANGAVQVWGNYTFRVNASDVTVNITFKEVTPPPTYSITLNYDSSKGTATLSKETSLGNEEIQLTVTPNDGFEVESVTATDANGAVQVWGNYTFRVNASDVTVNITFKEVSAPPTYSITLNYDSSKGTASLNKETSLGNEEIQLTVTPNDGYEVESVTATDANGPMNVWGNYSFWMNYSDVTVNITFKATDAPEKARVNMSFTPSSVELTLGEQFTAPTLTIKDAENNDLTDLTITYGSSNESVATVAEDGTVTINAVGSTTITASFVGNDTYEAASASYNILVKEPVATTYTISAPKPDHGNIIVTSSMAIEGADVTFSVTPDAGYSVESVTVTRTDNGETVPTSETDGTYTFTMPASNVTVSATFSAIPYTVTITEGIEHGTVSINDQKETYTVGEPVTLSVVPEEGYELRTLYRVDEAGNTVEIDKSNYTFTMPASNVTVTATFGKIGYKVNFEITGEGTVTADQSSYEEGETVWITATPETGYSLYTITPSPSVEDWTFQGNGSYSFTMPASPVTISATFTINTWTLTYYVDGEIYSEVAYDYGEAITPLDPPTPTDDSRFSGWSIIPETMPDHNVSVYGYWIGIVMARITSSTGYASFSSVKPLDFTNVQGITAYIVVDADLEGNTASLHAVTGEIAANTGLILKGSVGTEVEIPTATSTGNSYDSKNWLRAVSEETTFRYDSGCFLLVERNGEAMFAEANSGVSKSVAAGHAYLYAPHASSAQGRYLRFVGDDTTGINDVKASLTSDEVIYNLRGQRVEKPNKGLYIINGKKVVLK